MELNRISIALVTMYVVMGISGVLLEPAYTGYLAAYGVFILFSAPELLRNDHEPRPINVGMAIGWVLFILMASITTSEARPAFRDLFRDSGAIFSFLLGFYIVPRALGRDFERPLFAALSALTIIIALWTIAGAARAYLAGASAYEWRGVYVPFAHSWLPYLMIAEYVRSRSAAARPGMTVARIGLCVLALLLSLSRTGLLLLLIFGTVTLLFSARRWFFTSRGFLLLMLGVALAVVVLPRLFMLDVVQQRINAGVGSDDLSLAWRAMEDATLVDYLNQGGLGRWLFGHGLGGRMPLPWGIVDFAENPSIPHLHNSFMTMLLKFGAVGLAWILFSIGVLVVKAHVVRYGAPVLRIGGMWLLLFVMGTAYTLQGMSEWSHLTFFGLTCALLAKAGRAQPRMSNAGRAAAPRLDFRAPESAIRRGVE